MRRVTFCQYLIYQTSVLWILLLLFNWICNFPIDIVIFNVRLEFRSVSFFPKNIKSYGLRYVLGSNILQILWLAATNSCCWVFFLNSVVVFSCTAFGPSSQLKSFPSSFPSSKCFFLFFPCLLESIQYLTHIFFQRDIEFVLAMCLIWMFLFHRVECSVGKLTLGFCQFQSFPFFVSLETGWLRHVLFYQTNTTKFYEKNHFFVNWC